MTAVPQRMWVYVSNNICLLLVQKDFQRNKEIRRVYTNLVAISRSLRVSKAGKDDTHLPGRGSNVNRGKNG